MKRGGRGAGVRAGGARSATACARCARCSSASASRTSRSARSTRSPSRSRDADANAQVFQVRDGVLSDRQSFYLENEAERDEAEVAEEFILQYYAQRDVDPAAGRRAARDRRSPPTLGRGARASAAAGRSRCAPPSAATSAGSSSWPSATRGSRSTRSGCARAPPPAARRGARRAPAGARARRRSRCGSSASTSPTSAARTRSRRWSSSRAARRRSPTTAASRSAASRASGRLRRDGGGALAAAGASASASTSARRTTASYDASFAALPNVIVIDGGKGQLSAGLRALRGLPRPRRGDRLARQADRGGLRARAARPRSCSPTTRPSCSCSSACATRRTASRSTHHRSRRDKAMTRSILDELPGVGPARKRALLQHFGSPEAVPGGQPRGARGGAGPAREGRARALRAAQQDRAMRPTRISRASALTRSTRRPHETGQSSHGNVAKPARLGERLRRGRRRVAATAGPPSLELDDLVVITGFSGAGKSTAMAALRGRRLLLRRQPAAGDDPLARRAVHARGLQGRARRGRLRRARRRATSTAWSRVLDELEARRRRHRVLFLDADEQTLLNRYKETRRRHPLAPAGSVAEGIARRARAARAAARARRRRDRHDRPVAPRCCGASSPTRCSPTRPPGRLAVTFSSFGFKHGPARDADLAFDVRFLPNPHYEPELRAADRATTSASSTTSAATATLEEFYERLHPAARLPAARSTSPRARRTSRSRSAAPAAATARSRSPSTSRALPRRRRLPRRGRPPRRRQARRAA